MLNGGGDDVLVLLAEAPGGGENRPVVRFRAAGGKEHPVRLRAHGSGHLASGSPERMGGVDAKAKANNVPNENIERVIKKFSGNNDIVYEEITYEGYGPGGVAVIVKTATDNRNRTAGNIRSYFSKYHGNMGQTGCVSYLFESKGLIVILDEDGEIDEDQLMECALEAGAADFVADEGVFEIYTEPDDLESVRDAIRAAGYTTESAERVEVPSTFAHLDSEDDIKFMDLLLSRLEEDDDVQEVFHNWERDDD